jgi:uncharacterized protein DUF3667
VSHLKERKERICLNCNTALYGRFCHVCGQENLEPKETVWHLVNHFFQDITHFDGKFFSTVKYLLTRPGFLSKEYMLGRRASYLNPIRMYVFTSAIFFVILFSMTNADNLMKLDEKPDKEVSKGIKDWEKEKTRLQSKLIADRLEKDTDTAETVDNIKDLDEEIAAAKKVYGDTSTRKFDNKDVALLMARVAMDSLKAEGVPGNIGKRANNALAKRDSSKNKNDGPVLFNFFDKNYESTGAYDSAQRMLPEDQRDGWMKTIFRRRAIIIQEEVNKDKRGYIKHFGETFLHSFPKILFISLPFFALILKLVYVRRKQFYYTSHGIFTIHVYCAAFILLLVLILSNQLQAMLSCKWFHVALTILDVAVWIYLFIYLYKAMRRFYGQGRFKTIMKYLIISFLAFIVNVFLLVLFILISAISI